MGLRCCPRTYFWWCAGTPEKGPINAVGRAVAATVGMALGFLTVFGLFGVLTISAASTVQRYLPYGTVVIGVLLIALGVWLLSGRELTALTPRPLGPRWAPTVRLGSMYGYGVSYAIASLSCTVGPFLAVTAAGLRSGSILAGVTIYLAYVAGLTLVVGVLAIAAATASSALADRLRRTLPFVNRISGVLLVLVGLYVAYYGLYELRAVQCDQGESAGCLDHRRRPPAGCPRRLGAPARRMAVGPGVGRADDRRIRQCLVPAGASLNRVPDTEAHHSDTCAGVYMVSP